MRIGVYLGRHSGTGGGIAVYARAHLKHALQNLAQDRLPAASFSPLAELALYYYGDNCIFSSEFLAALCNDYGAYRLAEKSAGSICGFGSISGKFRVYLKPLGIEGNKLGLLSDQLCLSRTLQKERFDLLHGLANFGLPLATTSQLVTVHDVFQGWPPLGAEVSPGLKRIIYRQFYRGLFHWQFSRLQHFICDSPDISATLRQRFSLSPGSVHCIRLGVDEAFSCADRQGDLPQFLTELELEPGYVLVLASLDPRKNLKRIIGALEELSTSKRLRVLVIAGEPRNLPEIKRLLKTSNIYQLYDVELRSALPRSVLPYVFAGAEVLLVPTLAEGFGLPALEALAMKTKVVTARIGAVEGHPLYNSHVFICKPEEEKSIAQTLQLALDSQVKPTLGGSFRSMRDCIEETFALYFKLITARVRCEED